jgi:hypothetical protein
VVLSQIMKTAVVLLLLTQLVAPNAKLPQVMTAKFAPAAPIKAGQKASLTVSFSLLNGYKINRDPKITLAVRPVTNVKLDSTKVEASPEDKKSTDEYYVDLPTLKLSLIAARAGKYELPGKLTYAFCSKADGFCAKQVVDVKIPLQAE